MADQTLLGAAMGSGVTLIGVLAVYINGRQRAGVDARIAREKLQVESTTAREKLTTEATLAREKLLSDATLALQEQQSRYIAELQTQADLVSKRLSEVDSKLQSAQVALLACFNEKLELKLQMQNSLAELNTVRIQLEAARVELAEARATNAILVARLATTVQQGSVS